MRCKWNSLDFSIFQIDLFNLKWMHVDNKIDTQINNL